MGYCHYWKREQTISQPSFGAIVHDFKRIILAPDDHGVRLAGPLGDGLPEITEAEVSFNGLARCGHPENQAICIPFPGTNASGVRSSTNVITGPWFIGVLLRRRTCNGDCSDESFNFERVCTDRPADAAGFCEDYCKTGFRPYDFAEQCFLVAVKHHLRERIEVWSGGADHHWSDARSLCYLHLDYPLTEFRIDREDGLVPD